MQKMESNINKLIASVALSTALLSNGAFDYTQNVTNNTNYLVHVKMSTTLKSLLKGNQAQSQEHDISANSSKDFKFSGWQAGACLGSIHVTVYKDSSKSTKLFDKKYTINNSNDSEAIAMDGMSECGKNNFAIIGNINQGFIFRKTK